MIRHLTLLRGAAPGALAALSFLLLLGCGSNSRDENVISVVSADLTIPNAPPAGSVIYLEEVSRSGDLVTFNVRLKTDGADVEFDAINVELRMLDPDDPTETTLLPGIVQVVFVDPDGGPTPLGDCNACVATCGGTDCVACDDPLCQAPNPVPTVTHTNPFCLSNAGSMLATGTFLMSASTTPSSLCAPSVTVNGDEVLITLGLLAASTGRVRVKMVSDNLSTGDCEILRGGADVGILCFDGEAIFEATR